MVIGRHISAAISRSAGAGEAEVDGVVDGVVGGVGVGVGVGGGRAGGDGGETTPRARNLAERRRTGSKSGTDQASVV